MTHLADVFHALVVHFGLIGLFVGLVLGNIGLPVGAELLVPTAGALAAAGHLPALGPVPPWALVGIVGTLGELVGGSLLFAIGWFGGLAFVQRYGRYVRFRQHELERVHAFYARYGRLTVFWCRFVPFVRGVSALPPGISRMPRRYFLTYTALGSAMFCFALAYLGDVAGQNLDAIARAIHTVLAGVLAVTVVGVAALTAWWRVARARGRRPRIAKPAAPGRNK